MMSRPLGPIVENWIPAKRPTDLTLSGRWAAIRPINAATDVDGLWDVFQNAPQVWDYLYGEAPVDKAAFTKIVHDNASRPMQPCYTITAADDPKPLGYACFWTVDPDMGSIEIGNVNLSPALQRTPIATEAFFLMIDWAIANGYRRVEWKCNALNMPSRKAAQRMGFSYEGVFRKHLIVKERNRDTAWFALTDDDWPNVQSAFMKWFDPSNFDASGQQRVSLVDLTRPHLFQADPVT
ncbi:MAG: GNAT family protein [Yoonia sp.]|uniref:GNAT family N-acetyltransferase n=1 Tax=Yoonia sp. TaxID=2212373 RepID=UPI003263D498